MAKKKSSIETRVAQVTRTPRPRAATAQPKATPLPRLKPRVSDKSVAKAKSVFSKFSLSKFGRKGPPAHYVTVGRDVRAVQTHVITKAIDAFQSSPSNRAMTLALPVSDLKKLLPSFNSKSGNVQLSDVLGLMEQRMRGTEFYAKGNPTLNRLAVQANVQKILSSFKKDTKK